MEGIMAQGTKEITYQEPTFNHLKAKTFET